jgi:hypothetical protein
MYRIARSAVVDNRGLIALGVLAFIALWNLVLCQRQVELATSGVAVWWTILCAIGVINLCGWQRSALGLARRWPADPSMQRFQRWQLLFSAVFVLGCAFRSVFPRGDVQRIGLVDTWLSSVLVGRSVATVAELCFVTQWALLLYLVAKDARSRVGVTIALALVPLIAIAEVCSWHAVLTTCYLGNAIEESIWTIAAALLLAGMLALWPRCAAARRPFLAAALVLGVAYIAFMTTVDVPMYFSRWQADEADGRSYLSLAQGVHDAWSRRVITYDWDQWRTEMPWMTLYFSAAVWWSIALVHAPRLLESRPAGGETSPSGLPGLVMPT